MAAHYGFTLDGYVFPDFEEPALGPINYVQPARWSAMTPLGSTAVDADVLTFLGLGSQMWIDLVSRASAATVTKLLAVYNGRVAVNWKTPQDATGVNVLMTLLDIEYLTPLGRGMSLCKFTLVRRA